VLVYLTEGFSSISLDKLLVFITGADCVPPLGFDPLPHIAYLHDATLSTDGSTTYMSRYPIASTCANTLYLPIVDSYDVFKTSLEDGVLMAPGFGRA
jgi:hypothetical protein